MEVYDLWYYTDETYDYYDHHVNEKYIANDHKQEKWWCLFGSFDI